MVGARGYPLTPNSLADSGCFLPEQAPVGLPLMGDFRIDFEQSKEPEKQKEHESYTQIGV